MGTPLGDFLRAKRDSIQPESLGLPDRERRRSPGVRRSDLASRAGISVEYLTRLEQGRDRHPSLAVLNAVADALSLDAAERNHVRYLAKISSGEQCVRTGPAPADRTVRPTVVRTLRLLEPAMAAVTNRLGDIVAHTSGYESVMAASGLLDSEAPNLTRYVFTDPKAHDFFLDWDEIADEQVFDLWLCPSIDNTEWVTNQLTADGGLEFTRRLHQHKVPARGVQRIAHPTGGRLLLLRETLDVVSDCQQMVIFLPADEHTTQAIDRLNQPPHRGLRVVS